MSDQELGGVIRRLLSALFGMCRAARRDGLNERVGVAGHVVAELRGPDGALKQRQEIHNLITDVGDNYLASLAYGTAGWTYRLKTGSASTAAAKNGAGSYVAVADYNSGSAHAMAAGFPKNDATIVKITGTGTSGTLALGDAVISVTTEGGSTPDAGAGQGMIVAVLSATAYLVRVSSGTFASGAGHYLVQTAAPATNHLDGTMTVATTPNIATFEVLYAAGENTNTIRRVSIVDNATDAGEADATKTAAIAVFAADIPKGAGDTLTIIWTWTFLGA